MAAAQASYQYYFDFTEATQMPQMARAYGCPLIPLTGALIIGIAIGNYWPDHRSWAISGAVISLLCLIYCYYRRQDAYFSPLLLFSFLGYLLIQPWSAPCFPPDHISRHIDKGIFEIVGDIITFPQINSRGQSFILSADYLIHDSTRIQARGNLRVTVAGEAPVLVEGDQVRFRSSLRPIKNFKNPNGFDYKQFMAAQGVWASAYTKGQDISLIKSAAERAGWGWLYLFRHHLSEFVQRAASPDTAGVFLALLLGDMGKVEEGTRIIFQKAGIGHVLSISGLHVGIVGGTVYFLAFRMLSIIPWFLRRGCIRQGAAALAIWVVWGYGLLAGMAPATARSVFMISAFFGSFFIGRPHVMVNAVAIAAMLILIHDPPSLFSISCQLSFVAVIAILMGVSLTEGTAGREVPFFERLRGKVISSILISISAFLGTLPLIMRYFQEVSTVGVISNLIFVPIIEMCVLPFGLLALGLVPLSPLMAEGIFFPADRLLSASLEIIGKIADVPFSSLMTVSLSMLEVVCSYTVLFLLFIFLNGRRERPIGGDQIPGGDQQGRTPLYFIVIAVICAAILIGDIGYWSYKRFFRRDLSVTVLDVGDGLAILLEMPGGRTMLIDGGGFPDNSVFDIGRKVLAPFLLGEKICTVDEMVLSHPNSDHLNGLLYIAEHFGVKRFWSNRDTAETEGYRQLNDLILAKAIQTPVFDSMPKIVEMNGVVFKFLYPPADFSERKASERWRTDNNNSLVVQACFGSHAFLFPGDIEAKAEAELVDLAGDGLRSDVLIAPHHGSRTSGTAVFLSAVQPKRVVVSTGARKGQIRPHPEALARYREWSPVIYCTARDGALRISSDGERMRERVTE